MKNDTPECSHGTCGAERECTGKCKLRQKKSAEHAKLMIAENNKVQAAIEEAKQAGEFPEMLADALSETAHFLTSSSVADAAIMAARLPVIDPKYLDEQLGRDLPVMLSDDFLSGHRGWLWWVKWASVAIGCGLLMALIILVSTR